MLKNQIKYLTINILAKTFQNIFSFCITEFETKTGKCGWRLANIMDRRKNPFHILIHFSETHA